MSFLGWLFLTGKIKTDKQSERDKEIDTQVEIVNIKVDIEKEAEQKYKKKYNKLTDREKKIVDKHELRGMMWPTKGAWLDFKREKCEELLNKKNMKKKIVRKRVIKNRPKKDTTNLRFFPKRHNE